MLAAIEMIEVEGYAPSRTIRMGNDGGSGARGDTRPAGNRPARS